MASRTPRIALALAATAALAGAALGDTDAKNNEEDTWPAIFQDRTEVNVVNVDVVVTDKSGNPVADLQPKDFELYNNGELVPIANFFAVKGGEVQPLAVVEDEAGAEAAEVQEPLVQAPVEIQPEQRRLSLIVYVDEANILPRGRKRAFEQLREFLLENPRKNTDVMVVANTTQLSVRLPFSSSPHDVFATLEQMEKEAPVGPRFDIQLRNLLRTIEDVNVEAGVPSFGVKGDSGGGGGAPSLTGSQDLDPGSEGGRTVGEMVDIANMEASAVVPQIRGYVEERYLHTQRTIEMLRQFVNLAAGLDGPKAVLYVSDGLPLRPGDGVYEAYARRFAALGDAGQLIRPEADSSRDDATVAFRDLVAHANSSRVTFYSLFTASPAVSVRGSAADVGSAGGNFGTYSSDVHAAEERTAQDSLIIMAEGTGGRVGLTRSSFKGILDGIFTDFENHYSLGFTAPKLASGTRRSIEVKVPGHKDWEVRYRDTFREKTVDDRVAAKTLSALILKEEDNPLGIGLEALAEKPAEKGTYVVPLRVTVPLGKLVLLPGEKVHQAQVSMFVAVRDEKGRTSSVVKHLCPIRIPNAEILVALGRSATCGVQLKMRGGEQTVAVSLRDELASIESTASLHLRVPGVVTTARLTAGAAR